MDKKIIKKQKSHAFGKDIYLIGVDENGKKYWLEQPKWQCGWYWGFGYIETYTNNNNPSKAADIRSHQHMSGFVGCKINGKYIHNLYNTPELVAVTFDEKEGWKLSELFKQFYLLQNMAEFCHKELPGCHITTSPVNHGNMKDWYGKINQEMIPRITAEILRILSPVPTPE